LTKLLRNGGMYYFVRISLNINHVTIYRIKTVDLKDAYISCHVQLTMRWKMSSGERHTTYYMLREWRNVRLCLLTSLFQQAVHKLGLKNSVSETKHTDRLNFLICLFYDAKNVKNYNLTLLQHTAKSRMYGIFKFHI
jgi:hypothetical protein